MEDDLSGRQAQWKMNLVENNISGRRTRWKTTSVEEDLSGRRPQWKTTLLAWNQQNLLSNIGKSTLVESKSILKNLEIGKTTSMEDTSVEDTSVEDDLSRRQPQWKTTTEEDNLNQF